METNPARMRELLVGLPEDNVRAVEDQPEGPLRVHVESRLDQEWCHTCGVRAWVKDRPVGGWPRRVVSGRGPGSNGLRLFARLPCV